MEAAPGEQRPPIGDMPPIGLVPAEHSDMPANPLSACIGTARRRTSLTPASSACAMRLFGWMESPPERALESGRWSSIESESESGCAWEVGRARCAMTCSSVNFAEGCCQRLQVSVKAGIPGCSLLGPRMSEGASSSMPREQPVG